MIRAVVAGASGRMGRLAVMALEQAEDIELVGTLVRGDDATAALRELQPDVLVDLTRAAVTRELCPWAAGQGMAPVVGTSGLTNADLSALEAACRRGGVGALVVPNFSVGAVLQMQFAERLAHWMTCDGIHETHHSGKLDSPSGTAKATARRVADVTHGDPPVIHSQRRDGVVAIQRVAFSAPGEQLELTHEITDRAAFMPGLLLAVRAVVTLDGLVIGLDDLLQAAAQR